MDEQKSTSAVSTSPKDPVTGTITSFGTTSSRQRMAQHFLIWLDIGTDQLNENHQNTLAQLQNIVNNVHVFVQEDEAISFITEIDDMQTSLIVSSNLGQQIVPLIHDIPQLHSIYIFPSNNPEDEQWIKTWVKINGAYTEINCICESFQKAMKQYNQDSIAMSFVEVNENNLIQGLNQLEPTFMYTQIFKEILLDMDDDQLSIKNMVSLWRDYHIGNNSKQNDMDKFESDYSSQSYILWYTKEPFIYEMLNRALRLMKADIIIDMGVFIRHLHYQIEERHRQQVHDHYTQPFIIYRGQGLSTNDFEKLSKSKGRLMSFNNFLSTSTNENISLLFAESSSTNVDTVGVLFKMTIDPSVSPAPFASIRELSNFEDEEEILFSMHTIFRVNEISKLGNTGLIYQVDLTLTADDDQDLRTLTEFIREELGNARGWEKLGNLLLKLNQFDKAIELYSILLEQTSDQSRRALYYNSLGCIKNGQGDDKKAIEYYEKSIEIVEKIFPVPYSSLASSYNNIGSVYTSTGEYLTAISFLTKSLEIEERTFPANHSVLANSYNNIGSVYSRMGNYLKALWFYEKSLESYEKFLPVNHPSLATLHNNLGEVYRNLGEYSKALSSYEKSLEIRDKSLPTDHTDFAQSYNGMGLVYRNMGEYSKALSFYQKALEIQQKNLSTNHPLLATAYNNIAEVYRNMEDYSKALSFYKKSLEIQESIHPANHPDLAIFYNNIGIVYMDMGRYPEALSSYKKSLGILEQTLPVNHPDLATPYNNIGEIYRNMGDHSEALSFYEKALKIVEKALPANHPSLAIFYNNIGEMYRNMGDCSKALSFYEKALGIFEKAFPANHRDLATFCNNIGEVCRNMGEYSKALSFYQRALNIWQTLLPPNHPHIQSVQSSIEIVQEKM